MEISADRPTRSGNPADRRVLLQFRHGLGDAVQLSAVLQHLHFYHPDWQVGVAALPGKHTAFHDLPGGVYLLNQSLPKDVAFDEILRLDWHEARTGCTDWPSTKACRCLQEVFQLTPRLDLCSYRLPVRESAREAAGEYLRHLPGSQQQADGRYPVVLIHYEGNTSEIRKNLPHALIRQVCRVIRELGCVPVLLDWDRRSPLLVEQNLVNPGADHPLWQGRGTGDAEVLAALIGQARLMIGVDSGPLHVAGATETPTLAVWTGHHPAHFYDLGDHVLHLVPEHHESQLHPPREAVRQFFERHYRFLVYRDLGETLLDQVIRALGGSRIPDLLLKTSIRSESAQDGEVFTREKEKGLDYLACGDWQRQYARWLTDCLHFSGKRVLDVGTACGAIPRAFQEVGVDTYGVDINESLIQLGRREWPDLASHLSVCDGTNLHLYADGVFDAVHLLHAPDSCTREQGLTLLRELRRVTRPQGLLWLAISPNPQAATPPEWWKTGLAEAGWQSCADEYVEALSKHRAGFLKRYSWTWLLARRASGGSELQRPNERPIFVSGIPRSGTTWMQWFLSRHPRVHIHGQFPGDLRWEELWGWYERLLKNGRQGDRSNQEHAYEVAHYAGSQPSHCRRQFRELLEHYLCGFGPRREHWGLKSLTLCQEPAVLGQMETLWPQARYVVCLRNPFQSLDSARNTFRPDLDLDEAICSWIRMCRFAATHPRERTFLFQIDQLPGPEDFERESTRLLRQLGLEQTAETRHFLSRNLVVHKVKTDQERQVHLTPDVRRRLLAEHPELPHWLEQFGYPAE